MIPEVHPGYGAAILAIRVSVYPGANLLTIRPSIADAPAGLAGRYRRRFFWFAVAAGAKRRGSPQAIPQAGSQAAHYERCCVFACSCGSGSYRRFCERITSRWDQYGRTWCRGVAGLYTTGCLDCPGKPQASQASQLVKVRAFSTQRDGSRGPGLAVLERCRNSQAVVAGWLGWPARRFAIWAASSSAASKLSGRATPRPTIS